MIKNLLFDLGGVIMDIERDNCVAAFRLLGMDDPGQFLGAFAQKGPFMQIESGMITPAEFHEVIRSYMPEGRHVTDEQIDNAFMEFLIGIPDYRLGWLLKLRRKYKVYMLSNTNPIMWDAKIASEFRKDGLCREDYFDGIVTSFEAKVMKPEPGIFSYAVEKFGLKPEETLFIDDSQQNLEAAAPLGFRTLLVRAPGEEFMEELKKHHYFGE